MSFDARGINTPSAAPACPECDTPLAAPAVGRRPVYCGRSCSSKAYRRRRRQAQDATLAAALDPTRVETLPAHGPAAQVAQLGTTIERLAHTLARQLDTADPSEAAAATLASLQQAVERLLTHARQATATHVQPISPRDETIPLAITARVETAAPGPHPELDLVPPARRNLGFWNLTRPLPDLGPDWTLAGWSNIPTLYLVLSNGRVVGWVERMDGYGDQWIAVADDGYLVHEDTGEPLWHSTPHRAARTVQLALRQTMP